MSRIDLHLHTTHSDGSLSPGEVLRLAHKAKVKALAITDHDIVSGIPEAIAVGAELGIEIIPGVEISSCFGNSELHILGYCLHWQDPELNRRLTSLRESRHSRNPRIIEQLRSLGLDVTYEEVRALAGTDSVGRPHIARLLMEKKYVTSAKDAFDRYLAEGRPAYVARELPQPADAIAWIRAAGGYPCPSFAITNVMNFIIVSLHSAEPSRPHSHNERPFPGSTRNASLMKFHRRHART